jgi:hypothetical protein
MLILDVYGMDKFKFKGQNLDRVLNSKLGHAFVYAMQLHT